MFINQTPTGWIAETPAKINLFFEVLGKQNDNFHEIVSVAVPIQLCDTLTFNTVDHDRIQFQCIGNDDIPIDDLNLVMRAVKLLKHRFEVQQGAAITLTKRIPSQAGLGGGSSDAAAALRLANKLWNLNLSDTELLPLAAEIGSDCPLFFYDAPTISTGRGEKIEPLPPIQPLWFVLLKPPEGLSTAKVYAECMPTHDGKLRKPDDIIAALSFGDVRNIGQHLFNRLEVPAQKLWVRFQEIKNKLQTSGCLAIQMSGSGTAFFGLCENENHAEETFQRLRKNVEQSNEVFLTSSGGV